ncbi:MAG: polyprenyl synthetase family protein [Acidimicrobiia bacterium]|nr:polyprenyl synthetase family protein [Acidimicrobiia bacterium]
MGAGENGGFKERAPIVRIVVGLASLLDLPQLADDLLRVESALRRSVETTDPFLTEVAGHLIAAGGKRLRPALALAVAYASAPEAASREAPQAAVLGGVSVELVHLGSLYHDDVMDEALTRRGVESVNARWGNLVAILAGDFLLARASEIAATLGTEVAGLLAATIADLCEGQVRELTKIFDVARTEEAYLQAIEGKTAALMSASCRIGALTAGLPRTAVDALTVYGNRLGMVFQIVDDVLDVVCTDEELGKPAGNDLVTGVYTLPVIRAMAGAPELQGLLGHPLDNDAMHEARRVVCSDGAIGAALGLAEEYAGQAERALDGLDATPGVEALRRLPRALVEGVPLSGLSGASGVSRR